MIPLAHFGIELGSDICSKEMKLTVKFKKPKGFMGIELHEDGFVKANSLECAEASIRYRLIINLWSRLDQGCVTNIPLHPNSPLKEVFMIMKLMYVSYGTRVVQKMSSYWKSEGIHKPCN